MFKKINIATALRDYLGFLRFSNRLPYYNSKEVFHLDRLHFINDQGNARRNSEFSRDGLETESNMMYPSTQQWCCHQNAYMRHRAFLKLKACNNQCYIVLLHKGINVLIMQFECFGVLNKFPVFMLLSALLHISRNLCCCILTM